MGSSQKNLSDWERLTKPRVYSRSQHTTTKNDIKDWLKSVEDASSCASGTSAGTSASALDQSAHSGLGSSKYTSSTAGYGNFGTAGYDTNAFKTGGFGSVKAATKKKIEAAVSDARIQESAYVEAQELINQWVKEKVHEDAGLDDDFESDVISKTRADVKKQWDHLTKPDSEPEDDLLKPATNPDDIYRILEEDENQIVKGLMGRLMEKPLFSPKFTADLGMDDNPKPTVDPRVKMEVRQKMVKENREKRMQEKKKKLDDKRLKKEMDFQARKIVQQEEKEKISRQKQEEQEVQKQMAVIRKQMEEERKALEEQRIKEKREKDAIAQKAREELEKQREEERRQQRKAQLLAEQRQRNIQFKMAEIQAKQAAENLKILQRHFSAWYGVVVNRRVQIGKARATADWKCMLRAWNAWRACVRDKHLDEETRKHEQDVRERHRKEAQAKHHYRLNILRKYFLSWQIYTQSQLTAKEVDESKTRTKSKMAAFLQAAATGKIGQQEEELDEDVDDGDSKVEELFLTEVRPHNGPPSSSRSSQYTTRSEYLARTKKALRKPTEAWQVTKKHARLSKKELEAMNQAHAENQGQGQTARTDQSESPKEKTWQKAPYVVDSYANRHVAQQKILEQQQKQIKEQQRLIEELTYLQKQQMLQQQALQSQTQQLANCQNGSTGGGGDASKLQQHIDNLQKELITKNQDLDELQKEIEQNQTQETARSDLTQMSSTRSKASSASSKISSVSQTTTNSKHLSFLKSMEGRANERARLKKEREEKKRKEDEEKRAALLEKEEQLIREQEEEKKKRAEVYREKKRLEKERELEKQQFAEKMKVMTKAADEHYELSVMKYRGWLPWLRLVEMAREHNQKAVDHYKKTILRKCSLAWHNNVEEELKQKKGVADHFYHYLLVRRSFHNWRKYGQAMLIMEDKAERHYKRQLQTKVLLKWMDYASSEKVGMWHKERKAKEHNTRRIQLTCLRAWRRFPVMLQEEEEREKCRLEMRHKVAALLSDYSVDNSANASTEFL